MSIKCLSARCGNCGSGWWKVKHMYKKSKLRYQKQLEKFTKEWKSVSERQWAKNDEGDIEQNIFFLWTVNLNFCNYKNKK
jgi:hypothetical protein